MRHFLAEDETLSRKADALKLRLPANEGDRLDLSCLHIAFEDCAGHTYPQHRRPESGKPERRCRMCAWFFRQHMASTRPYHGT